MQTIIDNATKQSLFLFEDDRKITEELGMLRVGASEAHGEFFIGNPRAEKLTIITGIKAPSGGWRPGKYFHTGKAWKLDPGYALRQPRRRASNTATVTAEGATP